jgi:uncharacterized protein (TIGR03066 family)
MRSTCRAIICAAVLVVLAGSCLAADLFGTWEIIDGKDGVGPKFTIQFMKAGKMRMMLMNAKKIVVIDGTYTLKGNKLTLKMLSQLVDGRKLPPGSKEPKAFTLKWRNPRLAEMNDGKAKGKAPALLSKIR